MSDRKYQIVKCETLFQGFFRVDRYHVRHQRDEGPWSETYTREVFSRSKQVAGVLLYDPQQDTVVLIEQLRAGVLAHNDDPWLTEIVLGMVDVNETPDQAARREALEEAHCTVTDLLPITSFYSSPGGTSEHISLFVGRTHAPLDGTLGGLADEHEDICVRLLDATKAISLIYGNKIRDAQTMVSMQWFAMHHTELRSRWLVSDVGTPII